MEDTTKDTIEHLKKAALVGCSNGLPQTRREQVSLLADALRKIGLEPVFSEYIFDRDGSGCSGTARERASALMQFYRNPEVSAIFDISGGDMANEILPYLDFDVIAESGKRFWGYSDLTTILNSIYTKTGQPSVLYQVRNLVSSHGEKQTADFLGTVMDGREDLYRFPYHFLQGDHLQGIVVGGNIRCLLKLAGTPYWPDMQGKVLLLESLGGTVPQMRTYLSQLGQLGVFRQIRGIILGTFTKMEEGNCRPSMEELVMEHLRETEREISVVKTSCIGHGADSKAIVIGQEISLRR
ncbi:MAG: S66 peptidase family protein [Lachnospiraceae bacterium]